MIKSFRKNFILTNMLLVGLILTIVFGALGAFTYNRQRSDLFSAMRSVVEPWNSQMLPPENISGEETSSPPENPQDKENPAPPENPKDKERFSSYAFTVAFINSQEELTLLSNALDFSDETLSEISETLKSQEENFGTLNVYGVIYYKEVTQNGYKFVLYSSKSFSSAMVKQFLIFAAVFIATMSLIFVISLFLSKKAVKPLENAIAMERRFITDVSHDLKTPISVAVANNNIIKENPNSYVKEQTQWLRSTEDALNDMLNLINQMLTLSSLETLNVALPKETVNLSAAAEKCLLQLEAVIYEKGIDVRENVEKDLFFKTVPEYAQRIFTGLIDNTVKYEPSGGKIEVSLKREKGKIIYSVKNYGSVISENDIPHIFERFYRGDRARTANSGHGLGLAIIKQLADMINAEIRVASSDKDGTVFSVIFG